MINQRLSVLQMKKLIFKDIKTTKVTQRVNSKSLHPLFHPCDVSRYKTTLYKHLFSYYLIFSSSIFNSTVIYNSRNMFTVFTPQYKCMTLLTKPCRRSWTFWQAILVFKMVYYRSHESEFSLCWDNGRR